MKTGIRSLAAIALLVLAGGVQAQDELPLTGPAYRLAQSAYAAYAQGDYARAVDLAREAIRLRPDVARLHDLLHNAQVALAPHPQEPIRRLRDEPPRKARAPVAAPHPPKAVATPYPPASGGGAAPGWKEADEAYKAYDAGDFARAAERAKASLLAQPNNAAMYGLQVYALEKLDQADTALQVAEAGLKEAPKDENLQALRDRIKRQMAIAPSIKAWTAYQVRHFDVALKWADQAVALAPDVPSYHYLRIGALLQQADDAQARKAADDALDQDPDDAFALVLRAYASVQMKDVPAARADLKHAAAQDWLSDQQSAAVKQMVADIGKGDEMLAPPVVFCTSASADAQVLCSVAPTGGGGSAGPGYADATRAYEAYAQGDYDAAARASRAALAAESGHVDYRLLLADSLAMAGHVDEARDELKPLRETKLPAHLVLGAAYTAQRSEENGWASDWFKQAVDENDAGHLALDADRRQQVREAISDLDRTWGFNAALGYGTVGVMNPAFAPSLSNRRTLQAGEEIYWRPPVIGNRNGTRVELYARANQSLYDGTGGATGLSTNQLSLGLRWKPLRQQNLVLGVERLIHLGRYSRDDWLLRAAWSAGEGGGLKTSANAWRYWQIYAEADHFFENVQTLGVVEGRYGRSFRLDSVSPRLVVTPFAVVNAGYDSLLARRSTAGAGLGVSWRLWMREDHYHAPRSFLDFTLQYRHRLAGDDRSQGVFASLYFSY